MQQIQIQTATTDRVAYAKNAQSILERLKANDMELIEATLAYALQVFQSNEQPLRKLLLLRLIKDAIVIKCAKFINKYVQTRALLTFIGNICTHKLGDASYERGGDLFQGQDPQSSCEFLRLALELVEYLAITFPKDSKGAPTKFKMQFDELKQMGVKFYPQSELMNPFDPHVQIDAHQSQLNKPSQLNKGDDRKERDETMLELNNMKQALYQDIEMINDSLSNETDMAYINDVMETYSESMQVLEVNLAKQINKAASYEGVLSEDELAELYALKDFTQKFQKYYKTYLSELCTPDAFKKLKKTTLSHIQKIQNKDFDLPPHQEQKQQKQQIQNQFMNEDEQLERIKQQSKIEYEQEIKKSQIQQQQKQSQIQQKQKEEELQRLEEARQAKLREEHFRQEQLRQLQIKEEYERQEREEQQKKEQERLQQQQIEYQRQQQQLEQQRQQTVKTVQQRSQMKQQKDNQFQDQDYNNQFDTPTGYESNFQNVQQYQLQPSQQNQNNNFIDSNANGTKILQQGRQTSSFGQVRNDNQFEKAMNQFEQPSSNVEGTNQFNYQQSHQQDPMNKIFSSINKGENNFEENFDGLSQSTLTQQFFPLKMDQQIPLKQYFGRLIEYDNSQFAILNKFRLSDSQKKRFKISSLKGKAALVNSSQLQIGVKQSLQYVPLKEKNYLKLILYYGNKTQSPFDSCRVLFEGDNKSFQIWLKPEKIQERIEPGKQISQEIIGNFRQYENYKLINVIFQGQWANKQISANFCIPTTLVSFMDFKDISLQIFRAQWRGKKGSILKSETFLLNPKIVKTAYHIKKIFPKLCEFCPYQKFQYQQFDYFNDRQQQYITYKLGGIFELTSVNQNYMIKFIVLPNMLCTMQIIGTNEQLCKQMLNTLNWMLGLE